MQLLFIIAFGLTVLASLFIGSAMSNGYAPYSAAVGALFSLLGLFMPFMSEYSVLHRGFSKIGDNFKSLMGTEAPVKGEVEIIMPGQSRAPAEQYNLQKKTQSRFGIVFVLVIAFGLISYDAVSFYILGDGLESNNGPISNF
ncbi:hypothetical protein RYZ26_17015 [Terasakiella sp. A23]|uniref:hypothetical protein n=1 Tax=Terasakiella sp. FCG-A23 TaxID=3080561 RepID=UPI002952AB0F|nr:hypothetical protein [Terasakiella sp. A23]MDV7341313.1 hypothetical protein [Terasakiella sp. A23]